MICFVGLILFTKVCVAGDDLVEGKDGILNIVAIRIIVKCTSASIIPLLSKLGGHVEVEELDAVSLWVDEKIVDADIAMDNA
jgi:hypothetical protein